MPVTLKSAATSNFTTQTTIYTVPAATTAYVTALIVANRSTSADTTTVVEFVKSTGPVTVYIANGATVPAAGNVQVITFNTRVSMMTGDLIRVTNAAACDVLMSVTEVS